MIIQCMKPDNLFNFTFKAWLLFIDKGFLTLNNYPASEISHVIVYKSSLATE